MNMGVDLPPVHLNCLSAKIEYVVNTVWLTFGDNHILCQTQTSVPFFRGYTI